MTNYQMTLRPTSFTYHGGNPFLLTFLLNNAKGAVEDYLDRMEENNPDAFDELIACVDDPLCFKINISSLNQSATETNQDRMIKEISTKNLNCKKLFTKSYINAPTDETYLTVYDYVNEEIVKKGTANEIIDYLTKEANKKEDD